MKKIIAVLMIGLCLSQSVFAQRKMEYLNRGVYAVNQGNGKIFVSWRSLVTDDDNAAFNVYRTTNHQKIKINSTPLMKQTNFVDEFTDTISPRTYSVTIVKNGKEIETDGSFTIQPSSKSYLSISLKTPQGYSPNDISVGDVDGDGEYEIILHQTGRAHDNSQAGYTDPPIFQCYKLNGTFLWQINLGKNIREGAHYTQFMVYDLDGDGKAEVVMKTADGTIDGKGKVIGDSSKDFRNAQGYILSGPEYLTVFNGLTGEAMYTTEYVVPRNATTQNPTPDQLKNGWGDGYGNRVDRFLACVAYLDGVHPSVVMCRGYYTRTVLAAWDWDGKKLSSRWVFDSDKEGKAFAGQGNHNLSV